MLIALSETQQYMNASEASVSGFYRCPGCQEKVILRKGKINIPHFAHLKKAGCASFSEGETEEHIKGKLDLFNWLTSMNIPVQLEPYLTNLQQRPDILTQINDSKVVIEFQCSPISIESIDKRTKGYLSKGYKVIWITGQKVNIKGAFTAAQKAYISEFNGNYSFFHYHFNLKKLFIYSHIQTSHKNIVYVKRSFSLPSLTLEELFHTLQYKRKCMNTYSNIDKKKKHLALMSYQKQKQSREFFYLMYINHDSIQTVPLVIFETVMDEWMIRSFSYQWKYEFLTWVEQQSPKRVLTQKIVNTLIIEWQNSKKIVFYSLPNIPPASLHKPVFQFIDSLVKEQVLVEVGINKWVHYEKAKRSNILL